MLLTELNSGSTGYYYSFFLNSDNLTRLAQAGNIDLTPIFSPY